MMLDLFDFEPKTILLIAGVDEAGRGPLAGPVVAAAVILDPQNIIEGLNDSKKLSATKRELLFDEICKKAKSFAISEASVAEIDEINILQASLLAMQRAVNQLHIKPNKILVDGNFCPKVEMHSEAIIGGDALIQEISAASILAKVYRDRLMQKLDAEHPGYGLAKHSGYPTKAHIAALKTLGVSPIHRKTFGPVRELLI